MKIKTLKIALLSVITIATISCSTDDSSSSSTTTTGTTISTPTTIDLSALSSEGVGKSNYTLMLFDQPVSTSTALPPILKEVITNAQGNATFDLSTIVTTSIPKTYYVEAFVKNGEKYVLKSITHPSFEMIKGRKITTSIIVN